MRADMENVDTLIEARWVIPVEPAGTVLERHAVAVRAGSIVEVAPIELARTRYTAAERVELPAHALVPGLINLHTHAGMTLLRGYADDLPLMAWLSERIWPAEAAHVSAEFVRAGTLAAAVEMLRGGVTCANEMYFFPDAAADAFTSVGMRAALGIIAIEFPSAYASDADDYLARGLAVRDAHRHTELLSFCLAPHAPYTVSDRSFEKIARFAQELDLPVHIHLHETAEEVATSIAAHGVRPIERLARFGLIGPQTIAVHGVHLDGADIGRLARHGATLAHCPASNLKLASGIAPVAQLLDAGVNVGIGTDSAASNNRLDMFGEIRLAALLAKGASGRAQVLPAHAALAAATINGARALGLDGKIGSIVVGKLADLTAVDLGAIDLQPVYDPASHLVYCAGRENVTDVWVAGSRVVNAQRLTNIDSAAMQANAGLWQNRLRARA